MTGCSDWSILALVSISLFNPWISETLAIFSDKYARTTQGSFEEFTVETSSSVAAACQCD